MLRCLVLVHLVGGLCWINFHWTGPNIVWCCRQLRFLSDSNRSHDLSRGIVLSFISIEVMLRWLKITKECIDTHLTSKLREPEMTSKCYLIWAFHSERISFPCHHVPCRWYQTQRVARKKTTPCWLEQLVVVRKCNVNGYLWCRLLSPYGSFVLSLFLQSNKVRFLIKDEPVETEASRLVGNIGSRFRTSGDVIDDDHIRRYSICWSLSHAPKKKEV